MASESMNEKMGLNIKGTDFIPPLHREFSDDPHHKVALVTSDVN